MWEKVVVDLSKLIKALGYSLFCNRSWPKDLS